MRKTTMGTADGKSISSFDRQLAIADLCHFFFECEDYEGRFDESFPVGISLSLPPSLSLLEVSLSVPLMPSESLSYQKTELI